MKTVAQIQQELAEAGKPVKTAQLYRYFRRFGIKPQVKLRPVYYPADTAFNILTGLGLRQGPPGKAGILSVRRILAAKPKKARVS